MITKIKNEALKNSSIVTTFGKFSFNSSGVIPANKLPKGLLQSVLDMEGFVGLDAQGNPVTDSTDTEEEPTTPEDVTKEEPKTTKATPNN